MPNMDQDVYLDAGMKGWITTTAISEHWRVARWYAVEDLIQDGYVCYARCRNRYVLQPSPDENSQPLCIQSRFVTQGRRIKEVVIPPSDGQRRHFMALVQTAFMNHISSLSTRPYLTYETVFSDNGSSEREFDFEAAAPVSEEASLVVLLTKAPAEIVDVVERLLRDGVDTTVYLRSKFFAKGRRIREAPRPIRETTRDHWRRLTGDPYFPQRLLEYINS